MSHKFTTTNVHSVDGDFYASKSLALAFAVVGRLIAEGLLEVNLTDKKWPDDLKQVVVAAADVIYEFAQGGF